MIAPARSYRVASYIQAATRLGYRLLIVSNSKHSLIPDIASGITVDFEQPTQAEQIIKKAVRDKRIIAVIATDDLVVTLASRIARHLELPHNDAASAQLTRRKDLARKRLTEYGCHVPDFHVAGFNQARDIAQELEFPVVLKPLMLSGSRGVIRANDAQQFIAAASTVQRIVAQEPHDQYEREHFLVEQYLDGSEVALDGFVRNGQLTVLALFDKPEPLIGPYFEESYYLTPSRLSAQSQQAVVDEVSRCCEAYGLRHGPIHAEARLTADGVVLIEMASRTIGGQCAQLIEYALGCRLEELIIRMMCEEQPTLQRKSTHAGVLMIPIAQQGILKRVEGMTRAQQQPHVTSIEIHIQPGYELVPLPYGSSYLGFIFAQADSYDETYRALQKAYGQLEFITSPSWALEAR